MIFVSFLQLDEIRDLVSARRTPRRPEIQDNNLAAQLAERDAAVSILDRKIRSWALDARGLRAVAGGEADGREE